MRLFNTMSRKKEEFVPLEEGKVRMYVCGPTVYNLIHIGNARPMIIFDTVRRYLEYKGYEVKVGYYGDKEIDFIGERNNEKIYVQVALKIDNEKTAEREFGNLLKVPDNYPKVVVTEDSFHGNSYEGIQCCSVREFLKS